MANNTVTIVGNLTRDPEMRYTTTGRGQTTLGVAVSRRYQDRNGEWQEESGFYDVVCWGTLADNVAASLHKGSRVVVSGRLQFRSWENENGDKRSKIEIVADDVGPSLRWATADVHKVERSGPGDGGPPPSRPAPQTSSAGSGGGGGTDYDEYGEEPF
jgi:single-strand DNA-binding protein